MRVQSTIKKFNKEKISCRAVKVSFLQKSGDENKYGYIPFVVFPAGKPTPKYISYLGTVLPSAIFGLLVVYCLKDVSIFSGSHGLPELIAIAAVVSLHLRKRQMLLSIAGGTVCYMLLVQFVFK